jgi:uncharacterized protein (DUF1330 family)
MAAYVIVDVEVQSPEMYEEYKRMAPDSISLYGGRYLIRGGTVEQLEGEWKPKRCVVLEFPSAERARAWWNSKEYAPAKAIRQSCSETQMVLIEGMRAASED